MAAKKKGRRRRKSGVVATKRRKKKRKAPVSSEVVARNQVTGESLAFPGLSGSVQFKLGDETIYAEVAELLDGPVVLRLHVGMFRNMKIVPANPGEILIEAVSQHGSDRR